MAVWQEQGESFSALCWWGALAIGLAALTVAFPNNDWEREHLLALFMSTLSSLGVGTLAVSVAFGVGARLPILSASTRNAI